MDNPNEFLKIFDFTINVPMIAAVITPIMVWFISFRDTVRDYGFAIRSLEQRVVSLEKRVEAHELFTDADHEKIMQLQTIQGLARRKGEGV